MTILDGLEGMEVVGADVGTYDHSFTFRAWRAALRIAICLRHSADDHVVEVAPIYDNPGETTALAAAEVVHSLLGLMVNKPVKP